MTIKLKSSIVTTSNFMSDFWRNYDGIPLSDRTVKKLLQDLDYMLFENDLYIYTESNLTQDDKNKWLNLMSEGRGETLVHIGSDLSKMDGALRPKRASKKLSPSTYYFESCVQNKQSIQYFHSDLANYVDKGWMLRNPSNTDFEVSDDEENIKNKLSHVRAPSRYIIIRDPHLFLNLNEVQHINDVISFWMSSLVEFPEGLDHVLLVGKVMTQKGDKVTQEDCSEFSKKLGDRLKQKISGFQAKVTLVIVPYQSKGHQESWHGRHIYTSYAHHIIDDSTDIFNDGRVKISNTLTISHQLFANEEYQSRMSKRLLETFNWVEKYAPNHGSSILKWMNGWMSR